MLPQHSLLLAVLLPGLLCEASEKCEESLGMENGRISNAQLSASSSYEINSVGPYQARLNNNNGGGAWCPKSFISESSGTEEFLEIDLGEEHTVSGVVTQGRFANGLGQEFAEFFVIQYWRQGMEDFKDYKDKAGIDLFTGNRDTYTEVETRFDPPVRASRVRIVPFSYHPRTVCMRVELKGCKALTTGGETTTRVAAPTKILAENDESEKYELLEEQEEEEEAELPEKRKDHMVEVDINPGAPDHEVVVLEPWWETEYMGVAVGVLVTVIFILIAIIVFILYKNYKNNPYPESGQYYATHIPKFDHPESHWPERKLTIGRKLPPTPTTSEEHYTDSSAEYSSPLLNSTARPQQQQQLIYSKPQPEVHWDTFFPCPPPGTPPCHPGGAHRSMYLKPVSHYAATDLINPGGGKIYGKSGLTYFL